MKKILLAYSLAICFSITFSYSQKSKNDGVKLTFDESGEHYVKFTGLAQVWLRHTEMNDGSMINVSSVDSYDDISIRRLRFQAYGQLTDRVFFYSQFGQNNFNFHSSKYSGSFFHDAIVEYGVVKGSLSLGTGLTGWSGLSRYASPSIGSIMTLDAPLYQQATNGVNDQFLRKLSLYAKGQIGKLDYRLAITQPMTVTGFSAADVAPTSTDFSFSNESPNKQFQGYFKYMFLDKESNLTPYQSGTYLGKKSIFNIGAGFIYQGDAMWALGELGETLHHDMTLLAVDLFYDAPLSETTALTVYAAYSNYDFGSGYIRNVGVNNPATGASTDAPGGFGDAMPMIGTGNTFYAQVGYLFGKEPFGEGGEFQPFASVQLSDYDYLADNMTMFEIGSNYFFTGSHNSKLSLVYQSRPTYKLDAVENVLDTRKGMTVLQYQISF